MQGSSDQSPNQQHKLITQGKNQHSGNSLHNGVYNLYGISNGTTHLQGKERVMYLVLCCALKSFIFKFCFSIDIVFYVICFPYLDSGADP